MFLSPLKVLQLLIRESVSVGQLLLSFADSTSVVHSWLALGVQFPTFSFPSLI